MQTQLTSSYYEAQRQQQLREEMKKEDLAFAMRIRIIVDGDPENIESKQAQINKCVADYTEKVVFLLNI